MISSAYDLDEDAMVYLSGEVPDSLASGSVKHEELLERIENEEARA